MTSSSRTHSTAGVSLVELLAAIAIISVLALIAIQTLGSVRNSAYSSRCLSNLRQVGVAINLYAQANEHQLPFGYLRSSGTYWNQIIYPYMDRSDTSRESGKGRASTRVLFCPAEATHASDSSDRSNYIANPQLLPERKDDESKRISIYAVPQPSNTIMISDGTVNNSGHADWGFYNQTGWTGMSLPLDTVIPNQTTVGTSRISWRHSHRAHALFVDGSAISFTEGEMQVRHIRRNK